MFEKKNWTYWVSIGLSVAALGFVVWKLCIFDDYAELGQLLKERYWYSYAVPLVLILLLLPLNIGCEVWKWRTLMRSVYPLGWGQALDSVIWGWRASLITPARLGDIPARCLNIPAECRNKTLLLAGLNSLLQTFTLVSIGCLALLFLPRWEQVAFLPSHVILWALPLLPLAIVGMLIYCRRYVSISTALSAYCISIVRFAVFSTQFYLMLRFVGIDLSYDQALLYIPIYYACVTLTPSISLSEAAVRTTWAVVLFGALGATAPQLTLAATLLWFINCVVPCLRPTPTLPA